MSEIVIPDSHWEKPMHGPRGTGWAAYVPYWEPQLRAAIAKQPDPALRFTDWLARVAAGESGMPGVRLIFLEQPYLAWAETVESIIALTEKETRESAAYEITHKESD